MDYYFKCPKCSSKERFQRTKEYSFVMDGFFWFISSLFPFVYADHLKQRTQCLNCNHVFRRPAIPSSKTTKVAFFIFILVVLLIGGSFIFLISYEPVNTVSQNGFISFIEKYIVENSRGITLIIVSLISVIVGLSVLIGLISTMIFRHKFKKEYKVIPEKFNKN